MDALAGIRRRGDLRSFGGISMLKQCTKCLETKPLDNDNFYFSKSNQRFSSKCKTCSRAEQNEKYANDPEFRERIKARQRTPEARQRKNRRNRERRANNSEWRESEKARQRERYQNNRDDILARRREKWANDTVFRERTLSERNVRYHNEPGYRDVLLSNRRERYHNDEEYRQRILKAKRTPEARQRENERYNERRANEQEWWEIKKAHKRERYQSDPALREKLLAKQRTPKARARVNQRNKMRRATDLEWRESQNSRNRERYGNDPEYKKRIRNQSLVSLYGITLKQRAQMEAAQCGLCAICRQAEKLFVDHNHEDGQVRALLCPNCNSGLGYFEEDEEILLGAVEYLYREPMEPYSVPIIPDEQLFARFGIPYWAEQSRDKKFRKQKNQNLQQKYGITIDQYEWMLAKNAGLCWICNRPEERKRHQKARYLEALYVDHDHQTGMIRGLLCRKCNTGVGYFQDDAARMLAAIAYLDQWNVSNADRGGEPSGR